MPRRHDHDAPDDFEDDTNAQGSRWQRRLIVWGFAAFALALGFLIPYTVYLNKQVTQRFGELRWQIPTRVYGRPLVLVPGIALDAATLKTELDAASYSDDGQAKLPGTYQQDGSRFTIASRGYIDVDGHVPARRIDVSLAGGRVVTLRDAGDRKALESARLDPARIATLYGQKQEERRLVRMEEVPELLVTGLQAVEDRDFNSHHGIDLSGMVRAAWIMARSGGQVRQGASTLTQQLARSGLLGIGKEQTLTRKFNEILYAVIMEARYDKRTILEAYLNQVYLGQRGGQAIHGVSSGAELWFGRELNSMTTEQIALLIGLVKGPSYYDPRRNPERALDRRNFVLGKLHENNLINDAEYKRALAAPLGVPTEPGLVAANRFPAYVDLVRRQLAHDYPEGVLQGAGMSVLTGMSPSAQAYAEGAVTGTIKRLDNKKRPPLQAGWCSPTCTTAMCWRWSAAARWPSRASIVRWKRSGRWARCSSRSCTCWRWPRRTAGRCPAGSTTRRSPCSSAAAGPGRPAIPTTAATALCVWSMRWRIPTTRPRCGWACRSAQTASRN